MRDYQNSDEVYYQHRGESSRTSYTRSKSHVQLYRARDPTPFTPWMYTRVREERRQGDWREMTTQ